jgi:hypothetical protein
MAQQVISEPGYCVQCYPNANCQNEGPNNPIRAAISTEVCRAIHMLRTASARRALHSTGAVMAASIHATNRLELSAQKPRVLRWNGSRGLLRVINCNEPIGKSSKPALHAARQSEKIADKTTFTGLDWTRSSTAGSAPPSSLRLIVWIWDCPRCSSNPFLPHPLSSLVGETLNESVLIVVAADWKSRS